MGIADRDYMRDRNKPEPRNGPWRNGRLNVQQGPFSFIRKVLVFVGIIVVLTWFFKHVEISRFLSSQSLLQWRAPEVALPETGNVTLYQLGQRSPAIAEFKVIANSTRAGTHHLVKLIDQSTNEPVLSVFVRNGETAKIKVPLGTYKVNMAQGTKWYGETKMFGRDMQVKQGVSALRFFAEQNSITGHSLILEDTIDGNYPTRPLPADRF